MDNLDVDSRIRHLQSKMAIANCPHMSLIRPPQMPSLKGIASVTALYGHVQDLDEIPKAEAVQALKHCEWEAKPSMDDCVALEGSLSYFAYSWVAGASSRNAPACPCP